MKRIRLADRDFELSIPFSQIDHAIDSIAKQMNHDLAKSNPLMICILNGSFMFAADLMKKLSINCQISFIKLSSYDGMHSTGKVRSLIGLDESVEGRTIVILEDIIDTGVTIERVINQFKALNPADIKIASLFFKPEVCKSSINVDYVGMNLPDDFIVGYGLDYKGYGRNLKDIYSVVIE